MTGHQKGGDQGAMQFRGVCSLCENAPTCVFPRNPDRPLLYCDEFEIPSSVTTGTGARKIPGNPVRPAREREQVQESASCLGLCRLCEGLEKCIYPKPEGGVWHCEEYT